MGAELTTSRRGADGLPVLATPFQFAKPVEIPAALDPKKVAPTFDPKDVYPFFFDDQSSCWKRAPTGCRSTRPGTRSSL